MKRSDFILHIDNTIGGVNTLKSVAACKKDDVTFAHPNISTNEFIAARTNPKLAEKAVSYSRLQNKTDKNVIDFENHIYTCHIQESHFSPKKTSLQQEKLSNLFIFSDEFNKFFSTPRVSLNSNHRSHIATWTLQIYFKLLLSARNIFSAACCFFGLLLSTISATVPQDCSLFSVLRLPAVFCSWVPSSPTKDEIRIQTASLRHGPPLLFS